jgi:hypothetical protein
VISKFYFLKPVVLHLSYFSPDGNEKPAGKKAVFSCQKRATVGSSFYVLEK